MKKIIWFIIAILILGGALALGFSFGNNNQDNIKDTDLSAVVSMVGGQQIIDITAKGGYSPRVINAKANTPTTLRVATDGTYDCSSSLVIPKLNFRANLEATGVREIAVAADQAQGTLQGVCGMGMYSFKVNFN